MSTIYVFGPVHVEVNTLLHEIVHGLEMPDYMLSHKEASNHHSNTIKIHESDEHKSIIEHHDHEIIEIVEKILKGVDQGKDSSDSQIVTHKIDKHIQLYEFEALEETFVLSLETKQSFSEKKKRICKGFLQGWREPPQV